jgi:hypothetical protein
MKKRVQVVVAWLAVMLGPGILAVLSRGVNHRVPAVPLWRTVLGASVAGIMLTLIAAVSFALDHLFLTGTAALKAADEAALLGQNDEAERLLDTVNPRRLSAFRRRQVSFVRASCHYQRGAIDEALACADATIDGPAALLERERIKLTVMRARGLRALLRAAKGDAAGARIDIALARQATLPEVKARAALAEGLLLDRAGDRSGARAHLARERGLMFEGLSPTERAIARGLMRKSSGVPLSAYRHKASEPARGEQAISRWIERVAPGIAPHLAPPRNALAPSIPTEPPTADSPPGDEARAAIEGVRRPVPTVMPASVRWARRAALALVPLTLVVSVLERSNRLPSYHAVRVAWLVVFGAVTTGVIGLGVVRQARDERSWKAMDALEVRLLAGDHDGLDAALMKFASLPDHDVAAVAERCLADLAFQQGDLDAALAACDRCLTHLSALHELVRKGPAFLDEPRRIERCTRLIALLDPRMAALRASVLAALGRGEEAAAEVERIPVDDRAITQDRVRIFRRLRVGDVAGAAQLVARRPQGLRIDLRDEALSDLIVAAISADDGEMAALQDEIESDPMTERWIRGVAPELLARRVASEVGDDSASTSPATRAAG